MRARLPRTPSRHPAPRAAVALTAVSAILAVAAAPALAAPVVSGEFDLPAAPGQLAPGPDGNVWITIGGFDLARVTPDGTVTTFDVPGVVGFAGVTAGPDGNLWGTYTGGVARIPPGDPTTATTFPIAGLATPRTVVTSSDGNLWTASGDRVFRISPANPAAATSFLVPDLDPRGLAAASDNHVWVADFGGTTNGRLIRVAPDGSFTATPTGGGVMDVAGGPGGAVGFTNPLADPQFVGQLPLGGPLLTSPAPGADPTGIDYAADGAFWTANFNANQLGRLAPDGSYTALAGLSPSSGPRHLTAGPDGRTLWVGLETAEKVARVTGIEPPPSGGGGGGGGGGGVPLPPVDRTAPRILRLAASPTRFRAGQRLRVPRPGRAGVATRVTVALDEPASVRLQLLRLRDGYRAGGRCRVGRAPSAKAKRCVREQSVQVRTLRVSGIRRITVTGRVGKRTLPAGRYRLRATATDAAGNRSAARTIALRIVR